MMPGTRDMFLAAALLFAGPMVFAEGTTSWESELRFGRVGEAQFQERSTKGDLDAIDLGASHVLSVQARDGLLLRFGVEWERYTFGRPDALRVPERLQSASLVIGADLQVGEAWIFRLDFQPGFYSGGSDLRASDFNVPVTLGGSYFVSADLQLVAGISVDLNRKYPVLPGVGFRWKFAEDWVLDAILPTPRLEYSLTKSALLYLGADFKGGTYRVDGNFGQSRGKPVLDGAVVDYTQIRVGVGVSWKVTSSMTFDLEVGCVPVHDFDFHRADVGVKAEEIPIYGSVGFKARY